MPSPFPGIDPFIEGQRWEHFHGEFIYEIHRTLMPPLVPRYISGVGERVYGEWAAESPEREVGERVRWRQPDVAIVEVTPTATAVATQTVTEVLLESELTRNAVEVELFEPTGVEYRERFVEIRVRETGELVTVIELLSPTNKRKGGFGWHEYLSKRHEVLFSQVHLVELDLLRGGERMPMKERKGTMTGDYRVLVSRWEWRPKAVAIGWSLREPLPTIPVPLEGQDEWVTLNLQEVFTTVYERGGYRYLLDYSRAVEPPLSEDEQKWVQERLQEFLASAPPLGTA
ncbi:MAG: hypothetical protein HZLCBSQH_001277 [Candidatus Fervidibacterota bacterium]